MTVHPDTDEWTQGPNLDCQPLHIIYLWLHETKNVEANTSRQVQNATVPLDLPLLYVPDKH
jgi:hypothetical protein